MVAFLHGIAFRIGARSASGVLHRLWSRSGGMLWYRVQMRGVWGLIVRAWRGFVVLAEQAAAHIAADAQARAPVPTGLCLPLSACASCGQVGCCELAHLESEGV